MALLDVWPADIVPAKDIKWWVTGAAAPGPRAIAGATRRGRTDGGGYWMCSLSGASLWGKDAIRLGRVLEALCQGGAQEIIIPSCECAFAPWPDPRLPGTVPHGDDAAFSDDTEYQSRLIDVRLAADAALRATALSIEVVCAGDFKGGEQFSIRHGFWDEGGKDQRLYRVIRAIDGTLTISPPLRAATATTDEFGQATQLDFDAPGNVMRLTNPDEVMEAIRRGRFSELNAVFEEADY